MTKNAINNESSDLIVSNLSLSGSTISTISTNSNLTLTPNGNGQVLAPGISFDSGTNVLSTFTNTTSYTPVVSFGGGTTGITYSLQFGSYSQVGSLIFFSYLIQLLSKGTSTGTVRLSLPTALTADDRNPVCTIRLATLLLTGYNYAVLDLGNVNTDGAPIQGIVDNAPYITLDDTYCTNSTAFSGSGFYWV